MKVVGIIAEYNPLHNGHAYHLQEARRLSGADFALCIMSGHFVQRGEMAVRDKWTRARWALSAGADAVLELPAQYSLQSAQTFARGAVGILDGLGVITHLCFGAEPDTLSHLETLAELFAAPPERFHTALRKSLTSGKSYPAALQAAVSTILGEAILPALSQPNAILAVEYLCALKQISSPIKPVALARRGSHYHGQELDTEYASATAIRRGLRENTDHADIARAVPDYVYHDLKPITKFSEAASTLLIQTLRDTPPELLAQLPGVSEGLEHALITAARRSGSVQQLISTVKSKRYTQTRLQRVCMCALLTAQAPALMFADAQYARLLGFQKESKPLLSAIKKASRIPFITKAADYREVLPPAQQPAFKLNVRATDIYMLCMQNPPGSAGADFTENIIRS